MVAYKVVTQVAGPRGETCNSNDDVACPSEGDFGRYKYSRHLVWSH